MGKVNTGITIDETTMDEVDAQLTGTDSRSDWLNDAADVRLHLEERGLWEEFVDAAGIADEDESASATPAET